MSLEFAILGFLNYQPFSGYDLKKIFDNSVRHFWSADQSQIYRTLARLTEEGLTEVEIVEQQDRPDRKLYHITPAGREALQNWLAGPFPMQEARSAPLVQIFFAGGLSDEVVRAKFEEATAIFSSVLDRYQQVPSQIDEYIHMVDSPREVFFWMLTLELGIKTMQAQLEWAENVVRLFEENKVPAR
jgi:PadR family transcriptional regulator, regulatory protein AphA